jgi:steroid delta-isomerase-like uncharacterized protein
MSVESTRELMDNYLKGHDIGPVMADDVEFTIMGTGAVHKGPEAVQGMLQYFYSIAFDAQAELREVVYGENNASAEFDLVGKHVGEFAGIPATGKDVRIPLCVNYNLEGGKIKRARVYFEMPVLLQQLGIELG